MAVLEVTVENVNINDDRRFYEDALYDYEAWDRSSWQLKLDTN